MKITNRKDKNMNAMKITCNENHNENHQPQRKTKNTTMIRTTSYNKYHDEDHQQEKKTMTMIVSNSTTMKIQQHVMNTYNYNDHDHQPGHPLVPQKQNIEKERMCVSGKLNFKSQTKLLPQHYGTQTTMRLHFLFVWGHCSQTSQEVKSLGTNLHLITTVQFFSFLQLCDLVHKK